jgi:hypothetical protein
MENGWHGRGSDKGVADIGWTPTIRIKQSMVDASF